MKFQLRAFRRPGASSVRPRRLTFVTLAAVALALVFWVAATAVDNGNGTVTITVQGQWNWQSHGSDCNFDRAAAGAAIIWSDPTETGYDVGGHFIGVKTQIAGAWAGIGAGTDPNPLDPMVHPADVGNLAVNPTLPGAAGQVFVDPTSNDPNDFATWKGGCGREPMTEKGSGILVSAASESGNTVTITTAAANNITEGDRSVQVFSMFNTGYNTPAADVDLNAAEDVHVIDSTHFTYTAAASGLPSCATTAACKGKVNQEPWGSWGYQADANTHAFSHTYRKKLVNGQSGLPTQVCVNFYDVHGGGDTAPKLQLVNNEKEITVDQNGDNSIETNDFDVTNGANCVSTAIPSISTTATSGTVGGAIHDTATLGALGAIAYQGTVTFRAYGPSPDASTCTTLAFTSDPIAVNGAGDYQSNDFHPVLPGTYNWVASYSGDPATLVLGADTTCGDANETSTVLGPPEIHVTKTADAASVNAGDPLGFTVTISNTGQSTATGVSLSDALPAGPTWSIDGGADQASFTITGSSPQQLELVGQPTTLAAGASKTVHITAQTSAQECSTYDNTASVTTTNDGSDDDTASITCNPADIHILKTADALTVNAGDPIGFTVAVSNTGAGTATGVTVNDPLPAGPTWSIQSQSNAGLCSILLGTLSCGPTTLLSGANFSVHITAQTSAQECSTYDNTATVTTTNDGSDQSSASITCNPASIAVTKVADDHSVSAGDTIGFTIVVSNPGPGVAKGVSASRSWSATPAPARPRAWSPPTRCRPTPAPPGRSTARTPRPARSRPACSPAPSATWPPTPTTRSTSAHPPARTRCPTRRSATASTSRPATTAATTPTTRSTSSAASTSRPATTAATTPTTRSTSSAPRSTSARPQMRPRSTRVIRLGSRSRSRTRAPGRRRV